MPSPRNNNQSPPKTMTWAKASLVLALCVIFDALRFLFEQFWFFGPLLIGSGTAVAVSHVVGSQSAGTATGALVGGATALLGGPELEVFGIIMAMALGLLGWMVIGFVLLATNARIFKESAVGTIWFVSALFVSELPILGAVPALTIIVWRMYHTQIKKERLALRQYENEQNSLRQQEQEMQAIESMRIQNEMLEQEEEEADAEEIEFESADTDEEIPV